MKHSNITSCITLYAILSVSVALSQTVTAEISFGELVDKITILRIKSECIKDQNKLKNIKTELESLLATFNQFIGDREDIGALVEELYINNKAQWDMEDEFRAREDANDFGYEFIVNTRKIRVSNDRRCLIKKRIDEILGSRLTEEKSYNKLG